MAFLDFIKIKFQLILLISPYITQVKTQFQQDDILGFYQDQGEQQTVMQPIRFFPRYTPWGWINPFDPAKFTNDVKTCHQGCGDIYFDCAFLECDEVENTLPIHPVENEPTHTKQHTSIWTKFIRIISFGLLGNKVRKWSEEIEMGEKMRKRNSIRCFYKCRKNFRACYKDCICRRVAQNDTLSYAMCYGVGEPVTTTPSILSTILFRPEEISAEQYRYTFNWNKIQ